jgi:hypothetical protein
MVQDGGEDGDCLTDQIKPTVDVRYNVHSFVS